MAGKILIDGAFMDSKNFAFNQEHVVATYHGESHLQKPEEAILHKLAPELGDFSMLDMGVGGGRTTIHFAKWVKDYEAMDISDNMIEASQARFSNYPIELKFKLGDAASMDWVDNNSKDFVLFSYNGIDYVDQDTRLKILNEVNRVLKPGGYFVFSTHNLQEIDRMFSLRRRWTRNPITLVRRLRKWLLLNFKYNSRELIRSLKTLPFARFNDGAYDFGLTTYYIKPAAQLEQLDPLFENIHLYSLNDGLELSGPLEDIGDSWVYYLCQKPLS